MPVMLLSKQKWANIFSVCDICKSLHVVFPVFSDSLLFPVISLLVRLVWLHRFILFFLVFLFPLRVVNSCVSSGLRSCYWFFVVHQPATQCLLEFDSEFSSFGSGFPALAALLVYQLTDLLHLGLFQFSSVVKSSLLRVLLLLFSFFWV